MNSWMGVLGAGLLWSAAATAGEGPRLYEAGVDGLGCPFCAYGVEKKLSGLEGVRKVEVDIERGVVRIMVSGDRILDQDAVRRAIEEAGFTLRRFVPVDHGEDRG